MQSDDKCSAEVTDFDSTRLLSFDAWPWLLEGSQPCTPTIGSGKADPMMKNEAEAECGSTARLSSHTDWLQLPQVTLPSADFSSGGDASYACAFDEPSLGDPWAEASPLHTTASCILPAESTALLWDGLWGDDDELAYTAAARSLSQLPLLELEPVPAASTLLSVCEDYSHTYDAWSAVLTSATTIPLSSAPASISSPFCPAWSSCVDSALTVMPAAATATLSEVPSVKDPMSAAKAAELAGQSAAQYNTNRARCDRTLHVKFIPVTMEPCVIRALFTQFGEVHRIRVVAPKPHQVRDASKAFSMGFVEYASRVEAEAAMRSLSGLHVAGRNYRLTVAYSTACIKEPSPDDYDAATQRPCMYGVE